MNPALKVVPFTSKAPTEPTDADIAAELEALAARIRRGEVSPTHLIVHAQIGQDEHQFWAWRTSAIEHLGVLQIGKTMVMADAFRKGDS